MDTFGQADRPESEAGDLDRLWQAEFGNRGELVVRTAAIALSGLLLFVYSGTWIGPVWAVLYFAAMTASWLALRPDGPGRRQPWLVGMGAFFLTAIIFVSLPLYLMTSPDVVLAFCGCFGIIALAVFTLFHDAPPRVVHLFDIVLGWVFVAVAAARFVPTAPDPTARAVMVLLCLVVGGYYTMALVTTRANAARLRAASEQALEARKMEAIGRLSGGIAHDFNNILTVLQGSLELYHVMPEGTERDAMVQEAQRAGTRATGLVSQLLAYARRAPLDAQPVAADAILDELTARARRALPDGVAFEVRRAPAPVQVLADRAGLQAALMNLILNARDAVGPGGLVTLAVDVARGPAEAADPAPPEPDGAAHLCFSVSDDGRGMSADLVARATEPFFTTKPPGSGSGLGLPMAKGFAEQSGGALSIRSGIGGTIVSLHLPLVAGLASQDRPDRPDRPDRFNHATA